MGTPASGAIAADDSGGAVGGDGFNLASECLNLQRFDASRRAPKVPAGSNAKGSSGI